MSYKLRFHELALAEWNKLDNSIREPFKKKLAERLEAPHVPSAQLRGGQNLYKIKLRQLGYRLVYQVNDSIVTVTVIAVGKRERNEVYHAALQRLDK